MSDQPAITRFGSKLRALRLSHSLTLKAMAAALGLSAHGYISELETGKKVPTVELVLKIARLFHVTTDQLLRDELNLPSAEGNENEMEQP
jgi:transcriptional regulator with XRE-family HTH domain